MIRLLPVVLIILAAGCARAQGPETTTQVKDETMQPQSGGIFQAATRRMPTCLYWIANSCNSSAGKSTYLPLFEGIIDYDYQKPGEETRGVGKFAPRLAESWKQVDPKTYEFTLRQGAKWHDGVEFTAKDVLWSLGEWAKSYADGGLRSSAELFAKVESNGPYHVRITVKEQSPYFFESITYIEPRILPAHTAEKAGNPTGEALVKLYDENPIGTGPFKMRAFDKNTKVEMERFEGYWKHRPYLDGIRVLPLLDISTWQAAFATGKLDYMALDDKIQVEEVTRRVPGTTVLKYFIVQPGAVVFNVERKPFNDIKARRAIHLALDRQALNQNANFGEAFIGLAPMSPGHTIAGLGIPQDEYMKWPGYRQPKTDDVAEAKKLLTEAGLPPGSKIVLKHDRGSAGPSVHAEPVAGQLRSVLGLDVTVQPLEPATYLAQVEVGRDYEFAAVSGAGGGEAPALGWHGAWRSGAPNNYYGAKDPELDKIIEAAMTELDRTKRNELYKQFQRRMIDQVYLAPFPTLSKYQVWQPWLRDFYASLSSNPSLFNSNAWWLEQEKLPADRRSW